MSKLHRVTRGSSLAAAILVLLSHGSMLNGQDAVSVAKKAYESTVLLVMEDSSGFQIGIGSGFVVRKGVIATNLHVIEGASSGYAMFVGTKKKYDLKGVAGIDMENDLALLKIVSGVEPSLSLADSEKVEIGESIFAVGNPKGLSGTFSAGIVSGIREYEGESFLQITAPISPGSSGGPVLNKNADVVGIAVAYFEGGQNLNFAIPSNCLSGLLAKPESLVQLSEVARVPSKDALPDGAGLGSDGVVATQFLWSDFASAGDGCFSLSFKNNLRSNVKEVSALVVFRDKSGEPIDVKFIEWPGVIPARLAARYVSPLGFTDKSVWDLTTSGERNSKAPPEGCVDVRILDFEIVE